ncbi:hypothetical protein QJQ45_006605 [Haematococcus lacustris]|nr:hypothetical protein QJQ45_006605 [Haematococcus lacustris]
MKRQKCVQTKQQLKHDSRLNKARHNTLQWSAAAQPQLQQLAAAPTAGTSLQSLYALMVATKATWDALPTRTYGISRSHVHHLLLLITSTSFFTSTSIFHYTSTSFFTSISTSIFTSTSMFTSTSFFTYTCLFTYSPPPIATYTPISITTLTLIFDLDPRWSPTSSSPSFKLSL